MVDYRRVIRITLAAVAVTACAILAPPVAALVIFLVFVKTLRGGPPERLRDPVRRGTCEVSPPALRAGGDPVPVTITYTAGAGGVPEGGTLRLCPTKVLRYREDAWQLRLQWGNGWGRLQRKNPEKANYLEVRPGRDDVELSVTMMEKAMDRTQLMWLKRKLLQKLGFKLPPLDPRDVFLANQKISVRVERGALSEGDAVEFVLGAGRGLRPPLGAVGTDFAVEVDRAGSGDFELEASFAHLEAPGGRPAALEVVAPTLAPAGEYIRVLVRCVDSNAVLSPEFSGALSILAEGPIESPRTAVMPESGAGVAWFQARVTGPGVGRLLVRADAGGLEGTSNPVVCSGAGHRVLWGDLHTHSMVSDGTQEPWYLYHRARDLLAWDFTGIPDHDNWSLGEERAKTPEELDLMFRAADENYRPGEFVTFKTYEWTHHVLGHRNVLFGPDESPVFPPMTDARSDTPAKLLDGLAGRDALVIPHHPAWKTHFGEMRFDFGPRWGDEDAGAGLQRLVEVYSRHGNSEFYGCPRPISHTCLVEGLKGSAIRAVLGKEYAGARSGSYVRDALAAGYRFGLIAGSDEHLAGGDPRRAPTQVYGGGLTGVFAGGATRPEVWNGLVNRRVCGTTGARMLLEFSVNGVPHGAEIDSDAAPRITGHVVGTTRLNLVEIVKFDSKGYQEIWQGGGGREAVIDSTDRSFRENSFYYMRVIQEDGHLGWAGPTWVDYTPLGRI